MSAQADFQSAKGMFKSIAVAACIWDMTNVDRLMTYAAVLGNSIKVYREYPAVAGLR